MKKQISKKKSIEREELLKQSKKHRLILSLSAVPPFVLTVLFIVLYALRASTPWLSAGASALWFALGGLFIYANKARWGYVTKKGAKSAESNTVVTVYNIVLIFILGAFFLALTIWKLI